MRTQLIQEGMGELLVILQNLPQAVSDEAVAAQLKRAAEPMREQMVQEAPAGKYKAEGEHIALRHGNSHFSGSYRKGGSTKRDVRTKIVKDENGTVKVLVGVSKGRDKVGWRTHFIVGGVAGTARIAKDPFLDRAHDKKIAETENNFLQGVKTIVEKAL